MNRSTRPPSLLVRLTVSALIVVLLSLGLIGLAVDRAFRSAEQAAQRERLESAIFAVLAGLEVRDDGRVEWTGAPADSRLTQPQSGLYAGVYSPADAWFSPSLLGVEPPVRRGPVDRGAETFRAPETPDAPFIYRLDLGWETDGGEIVDLRVWVAEEPDRFQGAIASFRADLWRWLAIAAAVLNSQIDAGERPGPAELRETVQQMQARIRAELDRAARSGRRTMLPGLMIEPLAERVVRSLDKLYPDVSFELQVEPSLRANVAERDLMEILGNLLENAAKYGRSQVRVTVEAHSSSGRRSGLRLTVDDDGPGLDEARFAEMLKRGVRGDEIAEGQGLGLAIVQRIVENYHGRIASGRSSMGGLRVEVELKPS